MEGDGQVRMHDDATLFSTPWNKWDGSPDPATAFRPLEASLRAKGRVRRAGVPSPVPATGLPSRTGRTACRSGRTNP